MVPNEEFKKAGLNTTGQVQRGKQTHTDLMKQFRHEYEEAEYNGGVHRQKVPDGAEKAQTKTQVHCCSVTGDMHFVVAQIGHNLYQFQPYQTSHMG
eukprot:1430932-Amphidinium_carterae.1